MAETTIGWTATRGPDGTLHPGFTFNPWIGCTEDEEEPGEQSPECAECYAREGQNHRVSKAKGLPLWGPTAHRQVTSVSYWRQPYRWNEQARQLGVRLKVFCASLSDVFEDFDGPLAGSDLRCWADLDDVREALWRLIEDTPHLDWLLLTKRPQNVPRMVPAHWCGRGFPDVLMTSAWPRNVWLGTTAGTKRGAARRIPHLLAVPGVPVYFVSYEPALEDVTFSPWLPWTPGGARRDGDRAARRRCYDWSHPGIMVAKGCGWEGVPTGGDMCPRCNLPTRPVGLDWLIVGGESGKRARPFDLAWARDAVAQGKAAGVPVYVKQMGERPFERGPGGEVWAQQGISNDFPLRLRDRKGEDPAEWPEDLRVQEWPRARP